MIASMIAKEFKLRMPKKPKTYLVVMIGGTMMGAGASLAGGCNIGLFLVGLPTLAISSIIASVFLRYWATGQWLIYFTESEESVLKIPIQVFAPPYSYEDLDTAIKTAEAGLDKGHEVTIFLFADSV